MISEKGGRAAFRWIKQTPPWAQPLALVDPVSGVRRLENHQEQAEREAQSWHAL